MVCKPHIKHCCMLQSQANIIIALTSWSTVVSAPGSSISAAFLLSVLPSIMRGVYNIITTIYCTYYTALLYSNSIQYTDLTSEYIKRMLNHCLEWDKWVLTNFDQDRQWFNTPIPPSNESAAVTVDCIHAWVDPLRYHHIYTTTDIHCRDRQYKWDGGIK